MTRCKACGSEIEPFKEGIPFLLVVEGNDDKNFFRALSRHLHFENKFQFYSIDGRRSLAGSLKAIKPELLKYSITRIGICIDADSEASQTCEEAFKQAQTALRGAGLPAPNSPLEVVDDGNLMVSVMIMPDNAGPGMLETICNLSLEDKPEMECLARLFECLDRIGNNNYKRHEEKSRLAAFLAIQDKPSKSVGVAADIGYLDLSSEAFGQVREFLTGLAS